MFIPSACFWAIILIIVIVIRASPNDYDGPLEGVLTIMALVWLVGGFLCPNIIEYDNIHEGYHTVVEREITIKEDSIKIGKPEKKIESSVSTYRVFINILKFILGKIIINTLLGVIVFWIIVFRKKTYIFDN